MAKRRKSKKRANEHKVYRWIVAVVAAVAVVGLVSMFFGSSLTGLGTFLVNTDTDPPTINSQEAGATGKKVTVTFEWETSSGETKTISHTAIMSLWDEELGPDFV